MTTKDKYKRAHIFGKLIAWSLSSMILLILLHDVIWYEKILWALFNSLYWFGTNTFAYFYEEFKHWKHRHEKV